MMQHYDRIIQMLKNGIGLDASTIGERTVEKILTQRMMVCKIDSVDEYYQLLCRDPNEVNELLEFAVIPETWFFRDTRPFEVMFRQMQTGLLKNRQRQFNILSIPCSTGEEPFSIAMHLIDNGLPEQCFNIDAVDISSRALDYAAQGTYGKNSFRGNGYQPYQQKYFHQQGDLFKLDELIHKKVNFSRLNILHGDEHRREKYDFILCRNLLIYFDVATKYTAFVNLAKLLKKSGLLFIGHSEFGAVPKDIFKNMGSDYAFALCQYSHPDIAVTPEQKRPSKKPLLKAVQRANFEHHIRAAPAEISDTLDNNTDKLLQQAERLANGAQYAQAEQICQQLISKDASQVQAFYLLGLIASGKQDSEVAESMFRKTIFLDPRHYEALSHLSLLLEKKGDRKNAELFRQRASRTQSGSHNKT
ncbi:MAG TPA: CheR family methyltransferase [Gammaproteobacteria bacterium]